MGDDWLAQAIMRTPTFNGFKRVFVSAWPRLCCNLGNLSFPSGLRKISGTVNFVIPWPKSGHFSEDMPKRSKLKALVAKLIPEVVDVVDDQLSNLWNRVVVRIEADWLPL